MSTFSGFLESEGTTSATPDVDIEEIVKDDDIKAAFEESAIESAMRCVAENTINWNSILEACTIEEFCYLEENKQEMVYEDSRIKDFFTAARNFFLKIWEKIKSIFKKAAMQFMAFAKSDGDFIKKYKKDIVKAKNTGFNGEKTADIEVNVYAYPFFNKGNCSWDGIFNGETIQYSNIDSISTFVKDVGVSAPSKNDVESWKKVNKELNESDKIPDKLNSIRSAMLKKVDSSASDTDKNSFKKDLNEAFKGDKDSKKLVEVIDDAITFLEGSKKCTKALDDALKASKKSIDGSIRALNSLEKEYDKGSGNSEDSAAALKGQQHTTITKAIDFMKAIKDIEISFNAAAITNLKGYSRQCKGICVKAVSKAKHESTTMTMESDMSLLSGLNLV